MSKKEQEKCIHDYEIITKRVIPERTHPKQPQFTHEGAYFTIKKCKKCGVEQILDYKVEG